MSRIRSGLVGGALAAFALVTLAACSDVTSPASSPTAVARLSGGSGGGGGSVGGGGGGGGVRPCAITSFSIVNNSVLSSSVAPYWQPDQYYLGQAIGTTEKSCDTIPTAVMRFTDETNTNDGCNATIGNFIGSTYAKYGTKPMSRYDQFFSYFTSDSCVGTSRTIRATLYDSATGAVYSTTTFNWIVG